MSYEDPSGLSSVILPCETRQSRQVLPSNADRAWHITWLVVHVWSQAVFAWQQACSPKDKIFISVNVCPSSDARIHSHRIRPYCKTFLRLKWWLVNRGLHYQVQRITVFRAVQSRGSMCSAVTWFQSVSSCFDCRFPLVFKTTYLKGICHMVSELEMA